ncbi:GNAT family N-acetyltransferase [Marinomonas sp. PE14-40]|uniref:GNAT family N-acetyltransferase n=1 Tax=Marinomonas sp. PE14-40 TaxID=3060621 RepID=UPI003F67B2E7
MSDINPAHHHRHFVLLEGDLDACLDHFFSLTENLCQPILAAPDLDIFHAIKNPQLETCTKIANKKLKQVLGQSHEAVFLDIEAGLSASAISLIAGTIKGGGVLALALRDLKHWLNSIDQEQARYLPWPLTSADAKPNFKEYFLAKLKLNKIQHIKLGTFTSAPHALASIQKGPKDLIPSKEQNQLIEAIKTFAIKANEQRKTSLENKSASFVLAHRGRGKSTALGIALAQLNQMSAEMSVAITGPNKAAIAQLEKSYFQTLDNSSKTENLAHNLFFSPDSLIHSPKKLDVLIVDEAAALPLPMLTSLFGIYKHLIFSSTNHGYEGSGRGFGIKFIDYLKQESQRFNTLTLSEPIRWREGDALEAFISDLLLIKAQTNEEITPHHNRHHSLEQTHTLNLEKISQSDWQVNQQALLQCFSLLVSAHYQTSPDDIRWILDDPSVSTWILKAENQLISTSVISEEGQLDPSLALAVAQGIRRPRGHLLPQSLLAHEGHLDAGDYRYWRISRIASQSHLQKQGYASELLTKIGQAGTENRVDFLSTSFAATFDVVNFWQKNGFICVRLGTSRDQASGCYSVMMLKPLNAKAEKLSRLYQAFYLSNLKQNLDRDYPDIEQKLAQALVQTGPNKDQLDYIETASFKAIEAEKDQHDLKLFAHHHRPYETIRAQLYRSVIAKEKDQSKEMALLREAALNPLKEANFTQFKLHSKKAIDKALRQSVSLHLL